MNQEFEEPIRVAQIIGKLSAAGVESVINNYCRFIDHSKYQFDFIIDSDSPCKPRKDLMDMGARYFIVPPYQNIFKHLKELIKLFKTNNYLIVHSNMNTLSVFSLFAAWMAKVPVRICHNHSTAAKGETKKNILKYILRPFSKLFATHYCACSNYAGEWLFGSKCMSKGKVTIFNNAIDVEKFMFDPIVREEVRKTLKLQDKFVIGHVGRFCFQKNHKFLIDIFSEICKADDDAVLLLVGDGELKEQIVDYVNSLGLKEKVLFLGIRDDVNRLYQAMDVFIFPSRYEGLGLAVVEAQYSGLPVIASAAVPLEAKITDNMIFIDINESKNRWAEIAVNGLKRSYEVISNSKYDIRFEAQNLIHFYEECLKKTGVVKNTFE